MTTPLFADGSVIDSTGARVPLMLPIGITGPDHPTHVVSIELSTGATVVVGTVSELLRLLREMINEGMLYIFPTEDRPPHVASAPGQPPAPDTGRLRASYSASVDRTKGGAELTVGSGVEYAAYLEFGTTKMAARPHLRPAMTRGAEDVRSEVYDGVEGRERAKARQLGGKG